MEIEKEFYAHEKVCEQRYQSGSSRLKRIETILITSAGAIILLLITTIMKM